MTTHSSETFLPESWIISANYEEQTKNIILTGQAWRDNHYEITERGFYYNNRGVSPSKTDEKVIGYGSGLGIFTAIIEGLPSGEYIFASYTKNAAGIKISSTYLKAIIP